MALPATDAFTGANGTALQTYSANWVINSGGLVINTNSVAPASSGNECGARWNADTFANDQYAQATLVAKEGTSNFAAGVGVRHAAGGTATYYGYYADGASSSFVFKMVAGTWTQLGAAFGSIATSSVMRLEVQSTTLTAKIGGVSQGTRTDSAIASGSAGLSGYSTSTAMRVDTWEGSDLTTAVTGTLAKTLGTLTSAGTGSVDVAGTASPTLGALTAAGTGSVAVSGSAAVTLGALTSSGAGSVDIAGSLSKTLGALTLAAAGDNGDVAPAAASDTVSPMRRRRAR